MKKIPQYLCPSYEENGELKDCECGKCTLKNPAAVALGSIKSKRKARAARLNGKKGGRPKQSPTTF